MVLPLTNCSGRATGDYQRAEAQIRSSLSANPGFIDLIRLATLAPSGHNTQPWRFTPNEAGISIRPDFSRRTRVVDPDDHHLFVSLGCAAENLVIAAAAHRRPGTVAYMAGSGADDGHIDVKLGYGTSTIDALYPAMVENQSTRSEYDGRAVSADS